MSTENNNRIVLQEFEARKKRNRIRSAFCGLAGLVLSAVAVTSDHSNSLVNCIGIFGAGLGAASLGFFFESRANDGLMSILRSKEHEGK